MPVPDIQWILLSDLHVCDMSLQLMKSANPSTVRIDSPCAVGHLHLFLLLSDLPYYEFSLSAPRKQHEGEIMYQFTRFNSRTGGRNLMKFSTNIMS